MNKIAVIGPENRRKEVFSRLPELKLAYTGEELPDAETLSGMDLVLDLDLDEVPQRLASYAPIQDLIVVGAAVKQSLAQMVFQMELPPACTLVGWNSLPTFINKEKWECSLFESSDRLVVQEALGSLGIEVEWVEDRVGMVTPRILAMIINEACVVIKEGTASIPDIDQAMRLGTNYPLGPLEWADKIGIAHVHDVLANLREDTGDGRYKIAPLLKDYMHRGKTFYPSEPA
ncbi:3-hydroxyacyl-CoA dehydrogenase family protein [Pontibacter sp. G13]|uniref:3-hydroxyacyl-CoA dehydrogenase family protein n=1 Tax=Pontibacter sp. G13 TaxID=3074898 RepID=UPI00288B0F2E|nr:3-hydroxyacyl-CoA dehydrogenase family protein [Pontibacter sp. G13]WNJ18745.1 3-hydroxyacyl-CoA dehydrogenase family protein [Pontibacter sp. G13]